VDASSSGELQEITKSLFHGQLVLLTTQRLAGDPDQLMDDDNGQYTCGQRVEEADRPHSDVRVEHLGQYAPLEQRTGVATSQVDNRQVLE